MDYFIIVLVHINLYWHFILNILYPDIGIINHNVGKKVKGYLLTDRKVQQKVLNSIDSEQKLSELSLWGYFILNLLELPSLFKFYT